MTNEEILQWVIDAEEEFINNSNSIGMCSAFINTCPLDFWILNDSDLFISLFIPEFNYRFLQGRDDAFWWDRTDRKSRLEAFDKLINIYTNKLNNNG